MTPARLVPLLVLALVACGDDDKPRTDSTDITDSDVADSADSADTADSAPDDSTPADTSDDSTDSADSADGADTADGDVVPVDDQDGDGLTDAEEQALGTDPTLSDSDEDGYWDGWEASVASDPLDPLSVPTLELPAGRPYILDLVDIVEPELLRSFLGSIISRWPPILLFIDQHADGSVTLAGGIAERVALGPDDTAGTADDGYALELGSLDPATGEFQVLLEGTRSGDVISANADEVIIDLSNVSELVRGVRLRVEDVVFTTTFVDDEQRIEPTRLAGILSRAGVEEIVENADLPLPIDTDTAMQLLDPDGDGIINVDLSLKGRPAIASGWQLTPDAEPLPREPGVCCPAGLSVGDPIDAALVMHDQGLQPAEEVIGARVVATALSHPELLDFIATQRVVAGERRYYVYSPRGAIYFVRERGEVDGAATTLYRTYLLADASALEGELIAQDDPRSPLANQDAAALSDYASFIATGEPFTANEHYQSLGYAPGDERLVRVPPALMPYPFAYERLSQIFDDPRCGDFVLEAVSYSGSGGSHGHLGALQSRSPLIVSGKGVVGAGSETGEGWSTVCAGPCDGAAVPFLVREEVAHIVDVAPTVAKALGVAQTTGVGPHGRLADDVYLGWQDGRPLDVVLNGEVPAHALIVINDGLTSMELLHQMLDPARDLDAYRELASRGAIFRHGAITNFPSNTYPSHNVVGSGAYSGHHGIVDNSFYEREVVAPFAPIAELFSTEKFFGSAHGGLPIETLHQAVLRTFGVWHKTQNPGGVITASLNDPSTYGATLATLERRVPDGYVVPDAADELTLGGTTWTFPEADLLDAEGLLDNSTLAAAWGLYIDNPKRGFPVPRYAIINLSSTDGAGHKGGPHGDDVRELVLGRTNQRLRILIEILKEAGVFDDMLIVLSADHGMELLDPAARGNLLGGLPGDIGLVHQHDFLYIKQLLVAHSAPNDSGEVTFTVTDSDGGFPVGGAMVVIHDGEVELGRGQTAVDGTLLLTLDLDNAISPAATVEKSGFSTEDHALNL